MCGGPPGEPGVSGRERFGAGAQRGVQNAAVGDPQAGVSAQSRERGHGAVLERQLGDLQLGNRGELLVEPTGARGADDTSASVIVLAASSSASARIEAAASLCGSVSSRWASRMLASSTVRPATRRAAARG